MEVELFGVSDHVRMREALAIRRLVFIEEQGVPEAEEIDAHDRDDLDAVHALARDASGAALGTARLYLCDAQTGRIGRMAVLAQARRLGVGRALLDALVAEARRRDIRDAVLVAQIHALAFYAGAGFEAAGERVWEAGILHQPMRRQLTP
ncbi:MAG TPA: GNAT family N-acetyltransferase [Candidatus Acidoferrales bacterium]|nr:GNAT family N-acetyltransferase [Candidatus Acidoferrales bacterium]